jgi:hypothetical protein
MPAGALLFGRLVLIRTRAVIEFVHRAAAIGGGSAAFPECLTDEHILPRFLLTCGREPLTASVMLSVGRHHARRAAALASASCGSPQTPGWRRWLRPPLVADVSAVPGDLRAQRLDHHHDRFVSRCRR